MPEELLVLASSSPRRRQLVASLGVPFEWVSPEVDETVLGDEGPAAYVKRLAEEKALAVDCSPGRLVLGADTAVVIGDRILGKPDSDSAAVGMLRLLADREHEVLSGIAVAQAGAIVSSLVVTTTVWMAPISDGSARRYVATGEPLDKAGAYAIQGTGGVFVTRIEGSVSNVVGLPLAETARLLRQAGLDPL